MRDGGLPAMALVGGAGWRARGLATGSCPLWSCSDSSESKWIFNAAVIENNACFDLYITGPYVNIFYH